jgi:uncharacterized spore protein YtfJ
MTTQDEIKTTVDELLKVISLKNVIGEPMVFGDKTLIMVAKMGVGFGAGSGEGKSEKGEGGTGAGGGAGAGVTPVAVVMVDKTVPGPEGVRVLSLAEPSGLGKTLGEIASSVAERMGSRKSEEKKEKKDD